MFFFLNGSEFRQKLIGTIIRVLVRHLHAQSGIKQGQRPLRGEVSHQSPVYSPYDYVIDVQALPSAAQELLYGC